MGKKSRERSRIFIAFRLPDKLKKELGKLERHLGEQTEVLRFVPTDQLHITLAFLGYISTDKIPTIKAVCETLAKKTFSFALYPTQLGAFPRINRPSVIWIGLGGDTQALEKLTRELEAELLRHSVFPVRGSGGFAAHITLARLGRKHRRHEMRSIKELLTETSLNYKDTSILCREIVIYQSALSKRGPAYLPLAKIPLGR